MPLTIRRIQSHDINPIAAAFAAIGWNKPASQYERYLAEQEAGQRIVLVALMDDVFAGYVTIIWQSGYPHFRAENIPEIQDFNVLPHFRRQGIGSRLMDEAEQIIAQRSPVVGIGVGMYADYGTAQRMYVKRGYIPDGRGLFYNGVLVQPGESVPVDDDLVLHFTKRFEGSTP
jgi:GNAT superfamily N-acetyltransferase